MSWFSLQLNSMEWGCISDLLFPISFHGMRKYLQLTLPYFIPSIEEVSPTSSSIFYSVEWGSVSPHANQSASLPLYTSGSGRLCLMEWGNLFVFFLILFHGIRKSLGFLYFFSPCNKEVSWFSLLYYSMEWGSVSPIANLSASPPPSVLICCWTAVSHGRVLKAPSYMKIHSPALTTGPYQHMVCRGCIFSHNCDLSCYYISTLIVLSASNVQQANWLKIHPLYLF